MGGGVGTADVDVESGEPLGLQDLQECLSFVCADSPTTQALTSMTYFTHGTMRTMMSCRVRVTFAQAGGYTS